MSTIVTRAGKGSPLTNAELDANFVNLNADKYQSGDAAVFTTVSASTSAVVGNTSADSGTTFLVRGISKAVRIGTTAGAAVIDGVDQTGVGSYQPMIMTAATHALVTTGGSIFFTASNHIVEQRNGVAGQTYRLYNTYTSDSIYERAAISWGSNALSIVTEAAGGGTARAMQIGTAGAAALNFRVNGTNIWAMSNTDNAFFPNADNAYDIGRTSLRPRTGFFGTSLFVGTSTAGIGNEIVTFATNPTNTSATQRVFFVHQTNSPGSASTADNIAMQVRAIASSATFMASASMRGIRSDCVTNASVGSVGSWIGFDAALTVGASSTLNSAVCYIANTPAVSGTLALWKGFLAGDATANTVMGLQSSVSLGANKWNAFFDGTANNAFAGNVRIGSTAAPTNVLDVVQNVNGSAQIVITNGTVGTAATAVLRAAASTVSMEIGSTSSGYTTNGAFLANRGYVFTSAGPGMAIVASGGPISFASGSNNPNMRLTSAGLRVGSDVAPTVALDVTGSITASQIISSSAASLGFVNSVGSGAQSGIRLSQVGITNFDIVNTATSGLLQIIQDGTVRAVVALGRFGLGPTTPAAALDVTGDISSSSWTTNGIGLRLRGNAYTDSSTAISGTAAANHIHAIAAPTLAATNATVTTTASATLFIAGAPVAGANMTITNPRALLVASGQVQLPDGSVSNPSIVGTSNTSVGLFFTAGDFRVAHAGTVSAIFDSQGLRLPTTSLIFGSPADLIVTRDAANTLAQRNGTNAQTFRVYNTFTDASNYERADISWAGNVFNIVVGAAGTGVTTRSMQIGTSGAGAVNIRTNNVNRWFFTDASFAPSADNVYDIGGTAPLRPRTGYFGTSLLVGTVTTAFGAAITVSQNRAVTAAADDVGQYIYLSNTPASNSTTATQALSVDAEYNATSTFTQSTVAAATFRVLNRGSGSGALSNLNAIQAQIVQNTTTRAVATVDMFAAQTGAITSGSISILNAFDAYDQPSANVTSMVGFRGRVGSGTGRWNVYIDGTANNAFAGNVRIGSATAPTVALDVTGSAIISGNLSIPSGVINSAQGANIASAATLNLDTATGNVVDVTGTTTITAITLSQGRMRVVRFTGATTLTHGASLVLPTAANIVTAAGDYAVFIGYSGGVVRCQAYSRANGQPLAGGGGGLSESSGTFTPRLSFGGLDTGITYASRSGNWHKIGKLCTITFKIELSNKGSATGAAGIFDMPDYAAAELGMHSIAYYDMGSNAATPYLQSSSSLSRWMLYKGSTSAVWQNSVSVTQADFTNTSFISGSITFVTP